MDQDKVILWAEAKRLNIADYRKVSLPELRKLIATAKGKGTTPAKGKATATSANGAKGKPAARTAVKRTVTPAKGKTTPAAPVKGKGKPATSTAKSAPAKSTTRKPAATTRTAASGTAKRPTTGGKGKATAVRQARATTAKPRTRSTRESYRVAIDNKAVNWKLPSNVGQAGKRKIVLDSLREHKGDKAKVFTAVKRYATKWYPAKDKHEADRMVVWLIGRVALDYVKLTGQHESGQRVGYGTSTKPNDIRRRELRAAARKPVRTRAAAKPAAVKRTTAKGKAAPAARKPAQGRTAAPRAKATVGTKGKGRR